MSSSRWHLFFSGRVQGVGFRFTAKKIAFELGIRGWVRNLSDGRVELVAESNPDLLERFLSEVISAIHGEVQDVMRQTEPATGEFISFDILTTR